MLECLCRPGVLGGNMGNYPWLADSWPTSNLVHGGKEVVNCCTTSHDTTERYYNGMSTAVAWFFSPAEERPYTKQHLLPLQTPESPTT